MCSVSKVVSHISKSPSNNIYVTVPQRLLVDVDGSARAILHQFLLTTFWNNSKALECTLCAICLALRGRNIDRAFWGLSGGGVGQSLLTFLLATFFGDLNHRYIDMNIYYTDEELRKVASLLVDVLIATGQEAVSGSRNLIRLHLLKKHLTGDPVAERAPYAITTRMVELIGFKRFELNSMIRFADVTKESFNSMLRRSLVFEIRSKFAN